MLAVAILDDVGKAGDAVAIERHDPDALGVERLAYLVADEVENRLNVELRGESRLHAVDDRELVRPLLEQRIRRRQLRCPLLDLPLEIRRPLGVVERNGGLTREELEHVAVGVVESAEEAVHVDIQVTQHAPLDNQRRDDARPLA